MNQRLMLYRKVAAARRFEEIDSILDEATDRYGPSPDSLLNLADYGRIRVMADRLGVESIDRDGRTVVLKFRPQARLDPVRLVSLVRQRPELVLLPPASLRMNLDEIGKSAVETPRPRSARPLPQASGSKRGTARSHGDASSWWTARAREGEVRPGFTKEEILKPAHENPRAPGGTFEQVGALLSALLDQG